MLRGRIPQRGEQEDAAMLQYYGFRNKAASLSPPAAAGIPLPLAAYITR